MAIEEVINAIKSGESFLITAHMNLEGDALGSELAMSYLLRKLNKSCFIYNATAIPRVYSFLPSLEFVQEPEKNNLKDFDTAIILDCSDLGCIGGVKDLLSKDKLIINIDHHMDNKGFGAVNWVEAKASSAGEMVYELFQAVSVGLDEDAALCLYVAILTDTGSFRYSNTTPRTHMIAGGLMKYGIKPEAVFRRIYESYKLSRMKLLGLALSKLNIDRSKGIVWIGITQRMLKEADADAEDIEGFIEMARSIEGVKVAVLFQEIEKNKIKVGFRSAGRVNVSEIARYFGGGGHFAASGCRLEGKLEEVEEKVLEKVSKEISYGARRER